MSRSTARVSSCDLHQNASVARGVKCNLESSLIVASNDVSGRPVPPSADALFLFCSLSHLHGREIIGSVTSLLIYCNLCGNICVICSVRTRCAIIGIFNVRKHTNTRASTMCVRRVWDWSRVIFKYLSRRANNCVLTDFIRRVIFTRVTILRFAISTLARTWIRSIRRRGIGRQLRMELSKSAL